MLAVLWTGFFVLEGFDFGVGMLHGVLGRDEAERRPAINTIGPLWDGNEVWLIVAGAAMFAAFPAWYATMFSGFYLALVLLLVALIVRGVSFEYRGKARPHRWRRTLDGRWPSGSLVAPLLIGVALGDLLHGLPIDAAAGVHRRAARPADPYGLFFGLTLRVCAFHGATFLGLKTAGTCSDRRRLAGARRSGRRCWCSCWCLDPQIAAGVSRAMEVGGVLAVIAAAGCSARAPGGWAFAATTRRDRRDRPDPVRRPLPAA